MEFEAWFRRYGWEHNPFAYSLDVGLVGMDDIVSQLMQNVSSNDPVVLIGEYGAGKTTIMNSLKHRKLSGKVNLYINASKLRLNGMMRKHIVKAVPLWFRLFRKELVLLLDEAENLTKSSSEELKILFDEGFLSSIVFSCTTIENFSDSLKDRIGNRLVNIRKMTEQEAEAMLEGRSKSAGGNLPYSKEGLKTLISRSNFLPRDILENAELVCMKATEKPIGAKTVSSLLTPKLTRKLGYKPKFRLEVKTARDKFLDVLNRVQRETVLSLESGPKSIAEAVAEIEKRANWKTKYSSVGKQLSVLYNMDLQLVEKEGSSRPVKYRLTTYARKQLSS